jgi:hypothetical protein
MAHALLLSLLAASPEHIRLSTSRGPVHVLIHPHAELTVVYVHGYWTHVEDAWVQHHLREQFLSSGLDATFIVPEAPAGPADEVVWPDLEALLGEVERGACVALPERVVAAGHSGASRTLARWTASQRVEAFVLLDAFYTAPVVWERWLDERRDRRIFVLARATVARSEPFCRRRGGRRVRCALARESHMEIITEGRALPVLLREAS